MARLAAKCAFVTGAGGAIGGAIARRFAVEGARVFCTDSDGAAAGHTAADIAAKGGTAFARALDVRKSSDVHAAIETAVAALGRLDIVVNTAANDDPTAPAGDLDEADWNDAIAVNLTGTFLVCKYALPKLIAGGGGRIINIASQLGQVVIPNRPAYVTSKAAVIQLCRSLALDYAKHNIRVNSLSPGAIETRRLLRRFGTMDEARAVLAPGHPIGRLGQPDEIAHGAVFLASDESSFMTGADLVIDGGYTAV
ncbi:MAG: SDR family oxidoreductase [Alphaproteobacteria bacterium]|nr:SDR family oxidoreductase [Alphaproteobacteria bacterium]